MKSQAQKLKPLYIPISPAEHKAIYDLLAMAKIKGANIQILLRDAYRRGLVDGKELTKKKIIEAINLEK